MSGKKLTDLTRDELLDKCQRLIRALVKKHGQLQDAMTDLPPNKAANDRHQKHKRAWGARKRRLLTLLIDCLPFVDAALAERINYELDLAECDYQKTVRKDQTRKRIRQAAQSS